MYNKKGFVLLETVIVLLITVISMLGLFLTYSTVFKNLKQAKYYDNINDVYKLNILYKVIKPNITLGNIGYVSIDKTECSQYFDDDNCYDLMQKFDFTYIIYTGKSIDYILQNRDSHISNTDINYMKQLDSKYLYLIGVRSIDANNVYYVSLRTGEVE